MSDNKDTKGNHPTTSEDSLELRIKELEEQLEWEVELKKALLKKQEEWCQWKLEMQEELAAANHCWKECSDRLDWLEDRMAPENAGKSFVIELCDDYRDRFFEIKEDGIQPPSKGRSKAAKTARERNTESAKEMAERLGMEPPTKEEQMANLNYNLRELDK